jgi:two-component system sensor histidine kinase RegB
MTASAAQDPVRVLIWLRWTALAGQALTILIAIPLLGLPFAEAPLWVGWTALLVFNLLVSLSLRGWPPSQRLGLWQLLFDIGQLGWMLVCSGGAANPFVSLLLVPIALAALFLPTREVIVVALAATLAYAAAAWWGEPPHHIHGVFGDAFDLHLAGMAVNFVLSAVLFVLVLTHLARQLKRRERELAELRERAARDEGILGLATQVAAMAHSLNTPLNTLLLLIDDLRDPSAPPLTPTVLREDLGRANQLVGVCRDHVQQLVRDGRGGGDPQALSAFLDDVLARFALLRPEITLDRQLELDDPEARIAADPALRHLLLALLDNAADATQAQGQTRLGVAARSAEGWLKVEIDDQGGGQLDARLASGRLFASDKQSGLGLGLALSHATVERLGGRLALLPGAAGAQTRVELPLAALSRRS